MVEGVYRLPLLGELLAEQLGFAGELAELDPVADQGAEDLDGDSQGEEGTERDWTTEIETNDAGTVTANDEQTEQVAAVQTLASPPRLRRGWLSAF